MTLSVSGCGRERKSLSVVTFRPRLAPSCFRFVPLVCPAPLPVGLVVRPSEPSASGRSRLLFVAVFIPPCPAESPRQCFRLNVQNVNNTAVVPLFTRLWAVRREQSDSIAFSPSSFQRRASCRGTGVLLQTALISASLERFCISVVLFGQNESFL